MGIRLITLVSLGLLTSLWSTTLTAADDYLQLISKQKGPRVQAVKGELTFIIRVGENLQSEHSLWIRMDGRNLQAVAEGTVTLSNVPRGEHQFDLALYDSNDPSPRFVSRPLFLDVRRLVPNRSR